MAPWLRRTLYIGGLFLLALLWAAAGVRSGPILFQSDFESGDLSGWKEERCCDYSIQVVDSPARAGKHAARFEVRKDQPNVSNSKRAEIKLGSVPPESERWYAFSILLPEGHRADPSTEIVAQWHAVPDFDEGETWRTPPLALETEDGSWKIHRRWDARTVTPDNTPEGKATDTIGPCEEEKWVDWVFRVKWSWKEDGLIEVWKDGEQVLRHEGPNAYNDEYGTYFKMGIYKWLYKIDPENCPSARRVVYIDEVRVGDETAGYAEMAKF